jgi:hypothetical protein
MDDSEQEVAVGWQMTGTKIRVSFLAHFSGNGALP